MELMMMLLQINIVLLNANRLLFIITITCPGLVFFRQRIIHNKLSFGEYPLSFVNFEAV